MANLLLEKKTAAGNDEWLTLIRSRFGSPPTMLLLLKALDVPFMAPPALKLDGLYGALKSAERTCPTCSTGSARGGPEAARAGDQFSLDVSSKYRVTNSLTSPDDGWSAGPIRTLSRGGPGSGSRHRHMR
ncbi:hypothetical protein LTR56_015473 [Elasticomyces elasticus]|nr:hypothetical protein LTR56_015473 [Elasticomyces elasticus]KAK4906108.1 hypothetical protein LTR49_024692 [Elasticomyces elasticus]KAK5754901.1 hypothetical protein LTS12_015024 [Elasticomyces elasticus]